MYANIYFRSPFEVLIVAAFGVYCSAALVAFDVVATNTLRELPTGAAYTFLVAAIIGSVLTITGVVRGDSVGVLWERAGLMMLSGICAAYAGWAVAVSGARALAFALLLLAVAAASLWRVIQIHRALSAARKV
jgi:hypothetical protein